MFKLHTIFILQLNPVNRDFAGNNSGNRDQSDRRIYFFIHNHQRFTVKKSS